MENSSSSLLLISKLKTKDTTNKIKNSSPQLLEILRQRSREEMIQRRKRVFNSRRYTKEFEKNMQMEENLYKEKENWMLSEYDLMLQNQIEWIESLVYEDKNKVICPICQVNIMEETYDIVFCEVCGFQPTNCNNIQMLGNAIDNSVNNHSQNCTAVPGFTVASEHKRSFLYMTCEKCSFLTCVI